MLYFTIYIGNNGIHRITNEVTMAINSSFHVYSRGVKLQGKLFGNPIPNTETLQCVSSRQALAELKYFH